MVMAWLMPLCVVSGATTTTRPKARATSTAAASPFESYPSSLVTSISFSSFIVGILPAKITINHAHGRYFHAALAPNEKNFVYLQSLTGRISTSFIGRYAVAGT